MAEENITQAHGAAAAAAEGRLPHAVIDRTGIVHTLYQ
jgi:hypothetical protein